MGAPQRGNAPQYDVESNATWRPNPTLEPEQAVTLYRTMLALQTSASGVINELLARVRIDDDGVPVWADTNQPIWAELPSITQGTLVDLPERRAA